MLPCNVGGKAGWVTPDLWFSIRIHPRYARQGSLPRSSPTLPSFQRQTPIFRPHWQHSCMFQPRDYGYNKQRWEWYNDTPRRMIGIRDWIHAETLWSWAMGHTVSTGTRAQSTSCNFNASQPLPGHISATRSTSCGGGVILKSNAFNSSSPVVKGNIWLETMARQWLHSV